MAERKPLVINSDGRPAELPVGDTLAIGLQEAVLTDEAGSLLADEAEQLLTVWTTPE